VFVAIQLTISELTHVLSSMNSLLYTAKLQLLNVTSSVATTDIYCFMHRQL